MAENKKSFVLYSDLIHNIDHLTNEEKGILLQHLLEYVNDLEPVLEDRLVLTAWKPIERQLKRDLQKFNEVKVKRSDAGKESARLRALKRAKDNPTKATSVESVEHTPTNPTVNDNDNVNDNDINNTTTSPKAKGIDFDSLLMYLNLKTGKNFRIINKATRQKYNSRLRDDYTKDDIRNAITNACKDSFHKENGFKYLNPEYFSRSQTLDSHAFKKINGVAKAEINPYFPKN
jgi:uncharacterized phage protein (TIGR02220 family)